ncbi:hypothetical protein CHI12_11875 [Terribacillus saccharophilus]|uniref:Uncharacterized protein n=1 Tax=Terribacillus saccharophilus TaxID=361277 RepID=A0A268HBE5_9BACI|nr:hypothetical protein [Terribacillus saccharophilus]PAE07175.1 hypothetical protein CHI12_11875 [Terribacillus saccharophilus]
MRETKENSNQNNFNGTTNFNGPTQVAARDIINNISGNTQQEAKYTPEPLWRSPFTLAVLSWTSVAIGILGVFPVSKIVKNALSFFSGPLQVKSDFEFQTYLVIFVILSFLFILCFSLRRITKNQTRHPLLFNYAISGYGRRLILEKIRVGNCPQCGGRMKYYSKPVEWVDKYYSDGKTKREVTKRSPVLECKRNAEHWYEIDPAEDKVK